MKVQVIIATLLRDTLFRTLDSLKSQTCKDFVITTYTGGINEYDARNRASELYDTELIAFLDDDTYVPEDYIEKGIAYFNDKNVMVLDTAIEGAMFPDIGNRWVRVDKPYLGIGTTLWVRRKAFNEVGKFKVDWGLGKKVSGWRSDTALLYDIIDKYGDHSYVHASDMVVYHPELMKSKFVREIEEQFYLKYKKYVIKYIFPIDPRTRQIAKDIDPEMADLEISINR